MICCHWDCRRYCREVSPHVETHRLHNVLVRSMAVQTSFIPPSSFSPIGQHGHNRNIFFPFMCSSQLFLRMYLSEVSISLQYLNKWLLQHILHRPHWEIPHKSFRWCDTQLPVCLEELASEKKKHVIASSWLTISFLYYFLKAIRVLTLIYKVLNLIHLRKHFPLDTMQLKLRAAAELPQPAFIHGYQKTF